MLKKGQTYHSSLSPEEGSGFDSPCQREGLVDGQSVNSKYPCKRSLSLGAWTGLRMATDVQLS